MGSFSLSAWLAGTSSDKLCEKHSAPLSNANSTGHIPSVVIAMDGGIVYAAEDVAWREKTSAALRAWVPEPSQSSSKENLLAEVGKKLDAGKAPVQQAALDYFPRAIKAVANISAFGATKYSVAYSDKNWSRVPGAKGRYHDALGRHLLDESIDGPYAEDSGLLHAAHAAWNALAYLELLLAEGQPERKDGV